MSKLTDFKTIETIKLNDAAELTTLSIDTSLTQKRLGKKVKRVEEFLID